MVETGEGFELQVDERHTAKVTLSPKPEVGVIRANFHGVYGQLTEVNRPLHMEMSSCLPFQAWHSGISFSNDNPQSLSCENPKFEMDPLRIDTAQPHPSCAGSEGSLTKLFTGIFFGNSTKPAEYMDLSRAGYSNP